MSLSLIEPLLLPLSSMPVRTVLMMLSVPLMVPSTAHIPLTALITVLREIVAVPAGGSSVTATRPILIPAPVMA